MRYGVLKLLIVTTIIVILPTTFYIKNKRENAYKELSKEKNCMGREVCLQFKVLSQFNI